MNPKIKPVRDRNVTCDYCGESYDPSDRGNAHVFGRRGGVAYCPQAEGDNDNDPESAADWGLDYDEATGRVPTQTPEVK